jgi:hypothetical protein
MLFILAGNSAIWVPIAVFLHLFHFIIEIVNFIKYMENDPHIYGYHSRDFMGNNWEKVT